MQSEMGIGCSCTRKVNKKELWEELLYHTKKYAIEKWQQQNKSDKNIRFICQVEQLIDNADLPENY